MRPVVTSCQYICYILFDLWTFRHIISPEVPQNGNQT
jgi:hypothetical protein